MPQGLRQSFLYFSRKPLLMLMLKFLCQGRAKQGFPWHGYYSSSKHGSILKTAYMAKSKETMRMQARARKSAIQMRREQDETQKKVQYCTFESTKPADATETRSQPKNPRGTYPINITRPMMSEISRIPDGILPVHPLFFATLSDAEDKARAERASQKKANRRQAQARAEATI